MALNGSRIVFVNKSTFTITCVLVYAYHSHSWSTLSFFRAMTNEWNKTSTNSFHNLLCFTIFHEYYFAIFYSSSTSHLMVLHYFSAIGKNILQQVFTCSTSTMETPEYCVKFNNAEQYVKSVQS